MLIHFICSLSASLSSSPSIYRNRLASNVIIRIFNNDCKLVRLILFSKTCVSIFFGRERERNAFSLVLFNFIFNSLTWCIKSGCPLKWWVTVSEQSTHCFNTLCSALFCTYVTVEYQKEIIIIISKHKHKHTPVSCSIIWKQNETGGKHVCVSVRCKSGMETGCQSIGHCFD